MRLLQEASPKNGLMISQSVLFVGLKAIKPTPFSYQLAIHSPLIKGVPILWDYNGYNLRNKNDIVQFPFSE